MLVGSLAAAAHGAAMPVMIIVFGDMSDMFIYNAQWEYIADAIAQNISATCSPFCNGSSVSFNPFQAICSSDGGMVTMPPLSPTTTFDPFDMCKWCTNVTGDYITENIDYIL